MNDVIGSYPQYDIVGQCGPSYGPGYGYGEGGYPVNPFIPMGGAMAVAGPSGAPVATGSAAMGGPGWYGPQQYPFPIQQNQEPLVSVAPRYPTLATTEFVGFPEVCTERGEEVTLRFTAQILTKIIRLSVDPGSAFQFAIVQLTAGKETLVNGGPIPASMFLPDADDVMTIQTITISPGTSFEIKVKNISCGKAIFRCGAVARCVR